MDYTNAIAALADPSRRAIVDRLRTGALPVGAIANGLPISRPAVSQHLRVLSDVGLLTVQADGNKRLYAISPDGVAAIRAYFETLWDDALACYGRAASDHSRKG